MDQGVAREAGPVFGAVTVVDQRRALERRDPAAGLSGFNLSDGLELTFEP